MLKYNAKEFEKYLQYVLNENEHQIPWMLMQAFQINIGIPDYARKCHT